MSQKLFSFLVLIACATQFAGCIIIPPFGGSRRPHRHFQPNKGTSEVSVSYGRYSGTQLFSDMSGGWAYSAPVQTFNTGNIFASYHYYFTNRLSIGLSVGNQALQYDWYNNNYGSNNGTFAYHQNVNLFTTAVEMKHVIADFPYFQLYDLLGLGWSYRSESYTDIMPNSNIVPLQGMRLNLQVTPVGLRFGKNIGGYMELGIGYKGLVNTGLYYSFR